MSRDKKPVLAITMGDPNGIGPEIVVKTVGDPQVLAWCEPLVVGLAGPLEEAARLAGSPVRFVPRADPGKTRAGKGEVSLLPVPVEDRPVEWGAETAWSGKVAGAAVEAAVEAVRKGTAQAIVTAPISKKALNLAGYNYPGHTEMLAALTGTKSFAMMHVVGRFRLILATTHLPLQDVPQAITEATVLDKIRLADKALKDIFGIRGPRIAVTALNPHSGEDGLLSHGEDDRILQAVERAREAGIQADGPFPADTLFRWADRYDMIVFMYHDQGSIPFKWIARGRGVNWTLGLPFTRTSVDHGTGFDIAGNNLADPGSLIEAVRMAAWAVTGEEPESREAGRAAPSLSPVERWSPYTSMAGLYDYVMRHVDYGLWKRYLFKLFDRHRIARETVLELAAGTGRMAELLTRAGVRVQALDRSLPMLRVARTRLERHGRAVALMAGDLRHLPLKGPFPTVVCLYDSINYLMDNKQFLECLRDVRRVLAPGGHFIFDVTTEANSLRHFARELSFEETDDFSYVRRSYYDPVKKIQHNDFTIFRRDGDGFSRQVERHQQKIYFLQEISGMAASAGFEVLEALAGFTFSRADDRSTRIHFVLRKAER